MKQPPLIIYHGGCQDGMTAAWAARNHFLAAGVEPEFFGAIYPAKGEDTELPDVTDREVYMLDFACGRDQLLRIAKEAESFQVLDHHASHEEACKGLPFCLFDMDRSGAGMAWDFFSTYAERPWIVDYVEDRDLWRFNLPNSREVNAFIQTQQMTFDAWDLVSSMTVDQARVQGQGALAYIDRYVREMSKQARRIHFPKGEAAVVAARSLAEIGKDPFSAKPGLFYDDIPVVNAPYLATSELVGKLAEDALFAVGWFQRHDGLYQYSLRSRGDFDVSKLAKNFGGGGHAKAAGFSLKHRVTE